ncbi:MAG: hypothetical protein ACR2O6_03410, partial [Ilumatobacteraceae bacterium]
MSEPASDTGERRSRLLGVKLRALIAEHRGSEVSAEPQPFPSGAALLADREAWVLIEGPAARSLGGALAWAVRRDAERLHVVADSDTGLLARRAARFAFPIQIWFAEDRILLPAPAAPLEVPPEADPEHLELAALIEAAGATPNVEHGVVFGEVRGLEVCRVVDRPTVGHIAEVADHPTPASAAADPGVLLEVGVGDNDREAFQLLHGEIPTVEALRSVVSTVADRRTPDAPQHPLNRLAAERFLRWRIEQEPALGGLRSVVPAPPPVPRPNLKDPVPCVANGVDVDGRAVTVVCSAGVDLDLAPFLADTFEMTGRDLVAVLRSRDLVPLTVDLVGLLDVPVRLAPIDDAADRPPNGTSARPPNGNAARPPNDTADRPPND